MQVQSNCNGSQLGSVVQHFVRIHGVKDMDIYIMHLHRRGLKMGPF